VAATRSEPRAAVVALRRAPKVNVPPARALVPSLGALAVAAALAVAGAAAYTVARETSVFAVRDVAVRGAPPPLAGAVHRALLPVVGRSLVGLDAGDVLGRIEALPEVRSARYDRAFPHTLVVTVTPESPSAVLRAGPRAWLVADGGRVLRPLERRGYRRLPRIWLPASVSLEPGERVSDPAAMRAVYATAVARREGFRHAIRVARVQDGDLSFLLAGGRELRLGGGRNLPFKLAVADEILGELTAPVRGGETYLDVSFPRKAVAGRTLKAKVEGEG
jgi:cell division protein FtsQ